MSVLFGFACSSLLFSLRDWVDFREEIKTHHALLFVTPEYNRSIPAALKNALDVGSRPYGQSVLSHKPGAVVSASTSALGGALAHHHLRQVLTGCNVPTLQHPEMYIAAGNLFGADGKLKPEAEGTKKYFATFGRAVLEHISLLLHKH